MREYTDSHSLHLSRYTRSVACKPLKHLSTYSLLTLLTHQHNLTPTTTTSLTTTMGLIDRIQAKLELFRLEQRYTNRKNPSCLSDRNHYHLKPLPHHITKQHPPSLRLLPRTITSQITSHRQHRRCCAVPSHSPHGVAECTAHPSPIYPANGPTPTSHPVLQR